MSNRQPQGWDDVMRRIANGEPVQDVLDEKAAADRASFRVYLASMGPRGLAARANYDVAMRDFDLGLTRARAVWHSISPAQRRALLDMVAGRSPGVSIRTIRVLAQRDLVAWDGGAFTPEAKAVLTEHGRFVLKHGMPMPEAPRDE